MEKGTPQIIPLPRSNNAQIPTVSNLVDIPAAFIALERFCEAEQQTQGIHHLVAYANKISALAVIEHYKTQQPKTRDDFIAFLKQIAHRHCRTGYTGEPYSPTNALLAQIAWACKPDSLEAFWKMIYPEVTGVIGGNQHNEWPQYGEAILDETLAQGQPGAILNYRTIWKNAQSAPKALIDQPRVQDFCSAHRDFWLEVTRQRASHTPSVVFKTEFENYYQFFDEICKFMEEYNSDNHRQWEDAFDTDEAGIKVLLEFKNYQIILINSPRKLIDIFKSIPDLWNVIHNVTGVLSGSLGNTVSTIRCFNLNRKTLRTVLNQEDTKAILSAIGFAPRSILPASQLTSSIEGHDRLLYLPKHSQNFGTMDESSLVDLIKNHVALGIDLHTLAELYRPLDNTAKYKAKSLFHLIYQVNDLALGSRFLEAFLGKPLSFEGLISQVGDIEAGIKLLDYVDTRDKDSLNDEIFKDIESLRRQREKLDALVYNINGRFIIQSHPVLTQSILDDMKSLIRFQDYLDTNNISMIARCPQKDPHFYWSDFTKLQIDILRACAKKALFILGSDLQCYLNISNESAHILLDAALMIEATIKLRDDIDLIENLCRAWSRVDDIALREKITASINATELYNVLCKGNISWQVVSAGLTILINKQFFSQDHTKALKLMHLHADFEPSKESESSANDFAMNISALVRTADEAITISRFASGKMKLIFHSAMIVHYERLLQNRNDFMCFWNQLEDDQQAEFMDATQNKLPHLVRSYTDYILIGSTLKNEQLSAFKKATKPFHQPVFQESSNDPIEFTSGQIEFAVEHIDSDEDLIALINLVQDPFSNIVTLISTVSRKYQFNISKQKTLSLLKKPLECYANNHPETNLLLKLAANWVRGNFIDELDIPLPNTVSFADFSWLSTVNSCCWHIFLMKMLDEDNLQLDENWIKLVYTQLTSQEYAAIIKKRPSLLENLTNWITTPYDASYVFAHIPHNYLDGNEALKTKINNFINDDPDDFIQSLPYRPHSTSLIIKFINHYSANKILPITVTVGHFNSCMLAIDLKAAEKLIAKFDHPYDIHHILEPRYRDLIRSFDDLILAYQLLAHKNRTTRDAAKLSAALHISETYQAQMLDRVSGCIYSLINTPSRFAEALDLMRPHHQLLFKMLTPGFSLITTEYDYYLLGKNLSQGERYILQARVNKNLYPRERCAVAIFKLLVESQPMGAQQHAAALELVKRFDNKNLDWGQYFQLLTDARNYRDQDSLYARASWLASIDDEKDRIRATYKTVFELNPAGVSNATGSTVFFARHLDVAKINLEHPAPDNSRLSKVIVACTVKFGH
jgi:hypothetical protein